MVSTAERAQIGRMLWSSEKEAWAYMGKTRMKECTDSPQGLLGQEAPPLAFPTESNVKSQRPQD